MTSVACQTEEGEVDEACVRNELAMGMYMQILNILDDDKPKLYHDLGESYANEFFFKEISLQESSCRETDRERHLSEHINMIEEDAELSATEDEADKEVKDTVEDNNPQDDMVRLESQVLEAEWALKAKLSCVRNCTKDPVERWLDGALPGTPSASVAASLRYTASSRPESVSFSRPSSVALSDVYFSDEEGPDDTQRSKGVSTSELMFRNCQMDGVEVPESFIRIKLKEFATTPGETEVTDMTCDD